jgi:hypothetical protein
MNDITWILQLIVAVISIMAIFVANRYLGADKVRRIMAIVQTVVEATNELEITGDLVKMGKSKADYALEQVKILLAKNKMTFNEEELLVFIKSAVTRLRIEVSGTDAEKVG